MELGVINMCVFSDIYKDRPRTAGNCQIKSLVENSGQIFRSGYQIIMLGYGQCYTNHVSFLKCVGAKKRRRDLAGNTNYRDRIQHSISQTGYQVSRTGTAGGKTDTGTPGCPGISFGGMGGTLFVTD